MLAEVEKGNIGTIIVKDMSSGFDNDFLPFRDVINEYYAKDISKKKAQIESQKEQIRAEVMQLA